MLDSNATIIERLLAPLREAIAKTPKVDVGDANRLVGYGVKVQDLRQVQRSESLKRGRSHGVRPIEHVSALGFHQDANGKIGPGHPRLAGVPAGAMVHQDGTITLLADFTANMWHGHAINAFSWGVEFSCREPGVAGLERTFWRTAEEQKAGLTMQDLVVPLTDAQIASGRALVEWAHDELERKGGKLRAIVAHRQGRKSRTSDPGSRVWQEVAEYERASLGLEDWGHRKWGSGRPLPDVWCGAQRGIGYA